MLEKLFSIWLIWQLLPCVISIVFVGAVLWFLVLPLQLAKGKDDDHK